MFRSRLRSAAQSDAFTRGEGGRSGGGPKGAGGKKKRKENGGTPVKVRPAHADSMQAPRGKRQAAAAPAPKAAMDPLAPVAKRPLHCYFQQRCKGYYRTRSQIAAGSSSQSDDARMPHFIPYSPFPDAHAAQHTLTQGWRK